CRARRRTASRASPTGPSAESRTASSTWWRSTTEPPDTQSGGRFSPARIPAVEIGGAACRAGYLSRREGGGRGRGGECHAAGGRRQGGGRPALRGGAVLAAGACANRRASNVYTANAYGGYYPPAYGPPPGYAPPAGYAPPPGYAPPAGYVPPAGYAPPAYAPP